MLKEIKIGNLITKNNLFLAPMAGVTDPPYRQIIAEFGSCGLMFSEMIPSKSLFFGNKNKNQNKSKSYNEINAVQIAGNDPYYMAEAAKINVDLGANIIDINFGCPVKKVIKGFAGSAIMKDELLARQILETVVKAVNIPITVKMRIGWDNANLNAPNIAKIAEAVGIQLITVHGRTRNQMYEGKADWKFISKVKENVKIPIIANGDIKNTNDVKQALIESRADGIMIGRGIYGKPWLFKQIEKELQGNSFVVPVAEEIKQIIFKHLQLAIEYYGLNETITLFRKHLGWYSAGFVGASEFRNKINRTKDLEEITKLINEFFR